jgi:putative spermidine/putrescine transport system permease protein
MSATRPTSPHSVMLRGLMLVPALALIGLAFGGGLVSGLPEALAALPSVVTDPAFWPAFRFTLWIAVATTLLSAVLSVPLALYLRGTGAARRATAFIASLGLGVPHSIAAIAMLLLLAQSGLLARFAAAAGVLERPADFPALTQDGWGIGIILAYVWKEVPFLTLVLLSALSALGDEVEAQARTLGASRAQTLRHVLLPLVWPSFGPALAIVFAFVVGAFEVPLILGPHRPETLGVMAWQAFTDPAPAARAAAGAVGLIVALLALLPAAAMVLHRPRVAGG